MSFFSSSDPVQFDLNPCHLHYYTFKRYFKGGRQEWICSLCPNSLTPYLLGCICLWIVHALMGIVMLGIIPRKYPYKGIPKENGIFLQQKKKKKEKKYWLSVNFIVINLSRLYFGNPNCLNSIHHLVLSLFNKIKNKTIAQIKITAILN